MGIFSKPEVIFLKDSSDSNDYLAKLEELKSKAIGDVEKEIQKEIVIVEAGIFGKENIMFELKNSNMDMVVLRDIYIETEDDRVGKQFYGCSNYPKCRYILNIE